MRPEKQSIINEYSDSLKKADFVLMANYRGVTVEQFASLRNGLRPNGSTAQVVKNDLFAIALKANDRECLTGQMSGPTVVFSGNGDISVIAKQLKTFSKENNVLELKCGEMGGSLLSADDINAIAELPSREILLGKLVGTIAAPMSQLVGVMSQKVSSLLYVLKAVEEKKNS